MLTYKERFEVGPFSDRTVADIYDGDEVVLRGLSVNLAQRICRTGEEPARISDLLTEAAKRLSAPPRYLSLTEWLRELARWSKEHNYAAGLDLYAKGVIRRELDKHPSHEVVARILHRLDYCASFTPTTLHEIADGLDKMAADVEPPRYLSLTEWLRELARWSEETNTASSLSPLVRAEIHRALDGRPSYEAVARILHQLDHYATFSPEELREIADELAAPPKRQPSQLADHLRGLAAEGDRSGLPTVLGPVLRDEIADALAATGSSWTVSRFRSHSASFAWKELYELANAVVPPAQPAASTYCTAPSRPEGVDLASWLCDLAKTARRHNLPILLPQADRDAIQRALNSLYASINSFQFVKFHGREPEYTPKHFRLHSQYFHFNELLNLASELTYFTRLVEVNR